jgi:Tol biopolymer transport system component
LFASSHLNPDLAAVEEEERKAIEQEKRTGQRRRYSWPFDPYMDIYVCDLDGQNRHQLTSEYGYDAEGAYSRDGELIAYCHVEEPEDGDGVRNPDIWVMNKDGSEKRRITSAPGYDGGPFISPDGKWIIFRTDRKSESHLQIHVIGIDGKNEVELTDAPTSVNWGPYWHPHKPYVIWSGADHADPSVRPNYDLYLMRYEVKDGQFVRGAVRRVTDSPAADVLPVFSPDGKKLMWTSTRSSNRTSQLFIADFQLPEEAE